MTERWWIVVDVEEQEDGLDYEYLVKVWRRGGVMWDVQMYSMAYTRKRKQTTARCDKG